MTIKSSKKLKTDRIILGIDPGTNIMGYGIIHIQEKKSSLISMGVIYLDKLNNHYSKLQRIFSKTLWLVEEYNPDELSIEAPFFGKNVQSMLKLGRAQGVAMAAALSRDLPIFEYSPKKIKQSITGNGNASKEQVAAILQNMFAIENLPQKLDATDGLAAAVCHYNQRVPTTGTKKSFSGWKGFISENPDRIRK